MTNNFTVSSDAREYCEFRHVQRCTRRREGTGMCWFPSRAHQEIPASFRIPGGGEIFPFGNYPPPPCRPIVPQRTPTWQHGLCSHFDSSPYTFALQWPITKRTHANRQNTSPRVTRLSCGVAPHPPRLHLWPGSAPPSGPQDSADQLGIDLLIRDSCGNGGGGVGCRCSRPRRGTPDLLPEAQDQLRPKAAGSPRENNWVCFHPPRGDRNQGVGG